MASASPCPSSTGSPSPSGGIEATSGFVSTLVTTNGAAAPATPNQIVSESLVLGLQVKAALPATAGKPDTIEFFISTTINDPAPASAGVVNAFAVAANTSYCGTLAIGNLTAGTYYLWAEATNAYGTTARYPAGNGVAAIVLDNTGGTPGTPGANGVSHTNPRQEWKRDQSGTWSAHLKLIINKL